MSALRSFDPTALRTPAEAAELLGLTDAEFTAWMRKRKLAVKAMSGVELAQLWRGAPPKVAFSRAPFGLRAELAAYSGGDATRTAEVQRLVSLMRMRSLDTVEQLWDLPADAVSAWASRPGQSWRSRSERDPRQELGIVRPLVVALAKARGREAPAWLTTLLRANAKLARTDIARWDGHPWRADIEAALAKLHGTRKGVASRRSHLLLLAYHVVQHARAGVSLGETLADRAAIVAAMRDIKAESEKRTGGWGSGTEHHLLEAVRPVYLAGADGGELSPESARALVGLFGYSMPYHAELVPALVNRYRRWARCDLRAAGIRPQPKKKVRPPEDDEVRKRLGDLGDRIARAIDEHRRCGLTLDDFVSWQRWSPELRDSLGAGVAAHMLVGGGLRGGSLHAEQPAYTTADDTHEGAVRIDRIVVKRVAHEGLDGITTSHDNRAYDPVAAPGVECSTWTVLPITDFRYSLRDLLEWYLHACGQCLGPANACQASATPVLRWVELVDEDGWWAYREAAQPHVPARTSRASKDGDWLGGLRAMPGERVRFNPLWWTRDGERVILQDGLADRLGPVFGRLHRWRHYALLYLTTAYPLSVDEAALVIHMDPETARRIYNNPSVAQILSRMRARMKQLVSDERDRERVAAPDEVARLGARVRELEQHLGYLATVFGDLPLPPRDTPVILPPIRTRAQRPRRRRASPRGGDAFAA